MIDDGRLRSELRRGASHATPAPDLGRVTRRARSIRIRRRVAGAVAVGVFAGLVAVPISGLVQLGSESPRPAAPPDDAYLAFAPVEDFFLYSSEGEIASGGAQSALATNVPLASYVGISPDGDRLVDWIVPTDTLETMPADGIVITAGVWSDSRNPLLPVELMPARELPLNLDVARKDRSWEGQPDPDVAQWVIWATVNGRRVDVRVFFGRLDPTSEQLASAQRVLDRLVFPPPPPTTAALDNFGISLSLPHGWEGQLARFSPSDPPSLHVSTVPLTAWTDGVPTDTLGLDDVSFWLEENDGLEVGYERISLPVTIGETDRCDACPAVGESDPAASRDHAFYFRTFEVAGRSFELSVEFGTDAPTPGAIASVNEALSGLAVDGATPTSSAPASMRTVTSGGISLEVPVGWDSDTSPVGGVHERLQVSNLPIVLADRQDLGGDGITITVFAYAGPPDPSVPELIAPLDIARDEICVGFCEEGSRADDASWWQRFRVDDQAIGVRVDLGSDLSDEMLAEANAILATLRVDTISPPLEVHATTEGARYDDTLSGISFDLPNGWWAKADPATELVVPPILVAFGSYEIARGGRCAPTRALTDLPSDGALAWIWEPPPPSNPGDYAPWPPRVSLDGATPSRYECSGDTPTLRYLFERGGRYFIVQVALGDAASEETRALVERALSSFDAEPR